QGVAHAACACFSFQPEGAEQRTRVIASTRQDVTGPEDLLVDVARNGIAACHQSFSRDPGGENPDNGRSFCSPALVPAWKSRSTSSTIFVSRPNSTTSR